VTPDNHLVDRFRGDLDALSASGERIGVAVSGGPDSLALLLLASAARPGAIEAATVDHALRPGSRAEAEVVSGICEQLNVPHLILTAEWDQTPTTAIQEQARDMRYRLLADWLAQRGLDALAVAHHADDQAETLLMRLNRGSGVRGLAAMRPRARLPGSEFALLRPLLGWRRSELEAVCADAGLAAAADPSNRDERFERVRVRNVLQELDWINPGAIGTSAANLAAADRALDWATDALAPVRLRQDGEVLQIDASDLPAELQRRLLRLAFQRLEAPEPRGADLTRALQSLTSGRAATLSGLKLEGGGAWRVSKAPPRRS
jgi:tRNA(Ile)-lysidine synthase